MGTFREFLNEAGAVTSDKYGYCPTCSKTPGYRPQRLNPWQTRVQKCKFCGDSLFEKGDVQDGVAEEMQNKIAELMKDPEVVKGMALLDDLNKMPGRELEVYAHYRVGSEEADRLLEKAALVGVYKRKLAKLVSPAKPAAPEEY